MKVFILASILFILSVLPVLAFQPCEVIWVCDGEGNCQFVTVCH